MRQRWIAAAGGLVWRSDRDRRLVCLVHRQRYDDWSLPKGSVKPGEHPLTAAVREVAEETGQRAVPQLPLPSTRYEVDGVPKVVEYWAMTTASEAAFAPNSEVDRLAWLPVGEAVRRVRYPHDAALLRRWDALPPVTAVLLLVRHADAGQRGGWPGADRERPLSARGTVDAAELCRLLALFAPARLVSATPRRCRQTVEPLGLPVELDPALDEEPGDPDAAASRLRRLAVDGRVTVACTQGAVIPPVLDRLAGPAIEREPATAGRPAPAPAAAGRAASAATGKGDGWLLSFAGPRLLAVAPLRARQVRR
ncbi:MAG: NUDIX domain-containing protein [Micromonosporaceae bacterium]|nr:NUDIX domain-containing protein [Micromonosporaceae bacterium]